MMAQIGDAGQAPRAAHKGNPSSLNGLVMSWALPLARALIRLLLAVTFLMVALPTVSAIPAYAQEPSVSSGAQDFSDEKLRAFILAFLTVEERRVFWAPKIQAAKNEMEARALRQQVEGELEKLVEQSPGITVEEYNAIARLATVDEKLVARLNKLLKENLEGMDKEESP